MFLSVVFLNKFFISDGILSKTSYLIQLQFISFVLGFTFNVPVLVSIYYRPLFVKSCDSNYISSILAYFSILILIEAYTIYCNHFLDFKVYINPFTLRKLCHTSRLSKWRWSLSPVLIYSKDFFWNFRKLKI